MRFLATLFLLVVLPVTGKGQVTLTAGDYPSVLTGTDTLRMTKAASLFPAFSTATPGTWDMTLLDDSSQMDYRTYFPSSPSFGIDGTIWVGSYSTPAKHNFLFGVSEISRDKEVVVYTAFDLFPATAGGADTFYILDQTSSYSSPIREIAFPATGSSAWNSDSYVDISFELSVATFFYLHEPGFLRTHTQRNDVVTNWGKMRVRDIGGTPSPYFDVLQVRTTTITTDSAFLSGGPMPGHIQLLLGITQGKSDTVYSQSYYRKGEVTPLAYVEFSDATFSHALRAKTHVQRLSTSAGDVAAGRPVSLFPNPASGSITLDDPYALYDAYRITDLSGKCVLQGTLNMHSRWHTILLDNLPGGFYWLTATNESVQSANAGFVIST